MFIWKLQQNSYFSEELIKNGIIKTDSILLLDMDKVWSLSAQKQKEYRDYMYFVLGGCRSNTYYETIYYRIKDSHIYVGLYDLDQNKCISSIELPIESNDYRKIKNKLNNIVTLY